MGRIIEKPDRRIALILSKLEKTKADTILVKIPYFWEYSSTKEKKRKNGFGLNYLVIVVHVATGPPWTWRTTSSTFRCNDIVNS